QLPFTQDNSRQAVYAFSGDVYRGLDAYTIPTEKIEKLQDTVRIISGLYGILKPLDLVQPYRLEMGTKFPVGKNKNLYEFWKKKVTQTLNKELQDHELFLNLASNEYFKAIDVKALKVPVVNVTFLQFKEGKFKNIAIFSKLARGLMTRYIINTDSKTVEDIKGFNYENYSFDINQSSENNLVFTR
ncbi:MAG: peroxide stress protein YaaA, partial [Bacteroidia bacterium]|nr:peroxide stress protein YaaA [Bacteroidia bacterium]